MSIQPLSQGLKNAIKPQRQNPWELLLFPEEMKDRELLLRSPHADFFLVISAKIAGKSKQEIHSYFDRYNVQLNLEFANWLNDWGQARFADRKHHQKIEEILDSLGAAWDFPRGNRASNLEISLVSNQLQLLFISCEDDPWSWSATQNNRANAYGNRIKGDRGQNLEAAIAGYEAALEIYTKEHFPVQWATTQNNLANAYLNRIKGDRGQNLETAITRYESALEIYTPKEHFPVQWATTQNNRANAYGNRIKGDRAQNLETAIAGYEAALEIYTKEHFPIDWATTQNNLALAYSDRIKGDRAQNLENAIVGYEAALEIRTKEHFPIDWATTQNNLAAAYSDRIKGDRGQNLETAITRYESAMEIKTKDHFPIDWAMTQNNIANAYNQRIKGDRAQNLETAIAGYENALPIIASSGFLQQLESLKNTLANAYLQRVDLDTTDRSNLDNNKREQTNNTLQQLTQACLEQADWYKATLSLSLWSKALISQKAIAQAAQPLLQAISLDLQHNPQLIDTDLQELASLMTELDWQPDNLLPQWQIANNTLPEPISPLTPSLQAQICLTIGIVSIQEKYWYKGLDWLKACWEIHQQLDDLPGLAEVSYQLAIGHHIASNLSLAGIYYRDAQRIFQHLNDPRKVAFCHHGLGRLLLQLGKTELAIREFDQALAIYQTIPDRPQVASRIGDIHYYQRVITKMQDPTLTHQSL